YGGLKMSILIIGGSGLLGHYLKRSVSSDYEAPTSTELDLLSYNSISSYLKRREYKVIYIAAALTNVDECERDPDKSFAINCKAVKYIRELAPKAKIIYYSTDYVFDGEPGKFSKIEMPNPINTYGRHKLCSESYLQTYSQDHIIIRTSWLFGLDEKQLNFPMQIINRLKNNINPVVNPTHF